MNWMSGGPQGFSPWILSGTSVYYDGSVLIPHNVPGGAQGPGSLNVNKLYIGGQAILPNAYLPLTGGTLTGNLFITNPLYASVSLNKVGAPNQYTSIIGNYNNKHRWFLNIGNSDHDPDDGSNTGSNFDLNNYADNGSIIGTPLSISRTTGNAIFSGDVNVNGNLNPGHLTVTDISLFFLGGGLPGEVLSTNGSGTLLWTAMGSGGGGNGGGGAGYLPLTGGVLTGDLAITTTGNVDLILSKPATGSITAVWGKTNGVNRWSIELGGASAETGVGNTGSSFNIKNYSDTGANIGTPFTINRSNGQTTINNLLIPNISNISIGGGASGNIFQTDGAGNHTWVPASSVGIPEAPSVSGAVYGRGNALWTRVLPLSGGEILGSLIVDFNLTCGGTIFPSTLTMNNTNLLNFLDSSGSSTSGFILNAANMFTFSLSNASGLAQTIFQCAAHVATPTFTFAVPVMLAGIPTLPNHAATKAYVDTASGDIDAGGY